MPAPAVSYARNAFAERRAYRCEPGSAALDIVPHGVVALDEEPIVSGVVDRLLDVVAGETADAVETLPPRDREDLGQSVGELAGQRPRVAIPRNRPVLLDSGALHVFHVLVAVGCADHAPPHPYDTLLLAHAPILA